MAKYKVWNDNTHPHDEMFKGDKIHIPARSFIEMSEDDAVQLRGQFKGIIRDGDGQPLPQSFKMIRLELISAEKEKTIEVKSFVCQACKYKAESDTDLTEHTQAIHKDELFVDEEIEKQLKAKPKKAS